MKIRWGAYLPRYFFPIGGVTSIKKSLHSILHPNAQSNHALQEKGLVIPFNAIKQ